VRGRLLSLAVVSATALTCVPDLGPGDSRITKARVLAVRAEPAEAPPGTRVTFRALVASPAGTQTQASIAWDFCTAPRPLTDDNVVSNACLAGPSGVGPAALDAAPPSLLPAGGGLEITAATPRNGCSIFGPDTPRGGFRPTDPDPTGGYYQPLRADLAGAAPAFALARIRCDLGGADAAAAVAFAAAYEVNQNPALLPLAATIHGAAATLTALPLGARVDFVASWPGAAAETYAYFDLASQTVTSQREAMSVAWYSSAGTFDTESTGRAASDTAPSTGNGWTAPGTAGTAHLWIVLRDSRGGVDFAAYDVVVTP
jgi:hypothetical protein